VSDSIVPAYIIPFAFGNLLGPLLGGTGLLFNAGARSRRPADRWRTWPGH
jgi:hypothetical protein